MDRKHLKSLWESGKTISEIASEIGSTHGATNYWLVKHGIRTPNYRHGKVDQKTLREMAEVQRRSRREIANHFGVTVATVMNRAKKWEIKLPMWNEWKGYPDTLTQKQEDFLVGTLFGDGHIQFSCGNRSASFYAHHGPKQKAYIEWKRQLMSEFLSPAYKNGPVKDTTGWHFCTGAHPLFLEWKHFFYQHSTDGKWTKTYSKKVAEKLTPLGLAVWYMDDGTYSPRDKISEYTTHLQYEEAQEIQKVLWEKFSLETSAPLATDGVRQRLVIKRSSQRSFENIISPYLITSMRYKVNPQRPHVRLPKPTRDEDMVRPHISVWEGGGTETTTPLGLI